MGVDGAKGAKFIQWARLLQQFRIRFTCVCLVENVVMPSKDQLLKDALVAITVVRCVCVGFR